MDSKYEQDRPNSIEDEEASWQSECRDEYKTETRAYEHLKKHQGEAVPKVYGSVSFATRPPMGENL